MIKIIDKSKEIIKEGKNIPIGLEKIIIKENFLIDLDLIDWDKKGLRISFDVKGIGQGIYNKNPYLSKEEALKEYEKVLGAVKSGKYHLVLYKKKGLKLNLIK